MTDAPPTEPFEVMRQAYDEAVATWAKTMEQVVSTDEFASASGQFLKRYVEMQESIRMASQATAESLHIPTTDDLARVARLVINVERKVDEVSDEAHAIAGRLAGPPADLAVIAARLTAIEAKLDELARRPIVAAAPLATDADKPLAEKAKAPAAKAKTPAAQPKAAPKRAPARPRTRPPEKT